MYLVAGLGITGQSVLRYCEAQGESCLAFDTRASFDLSNLQTTFPHTEFALETIPTHWLKCFETIVLSPGIAKSEPWVVALQTLGKQVIGDIELFARTVNVPVIAITGSNGKSTVTTMTGMALQAAGYQVGVGGNIGEPVLDLILDEHEYDVYVLELSSFQLETTYSLESVSATVLNISEDHMDRYVDIEAYIQAKVKVFDNTDLAVIPEGFSELSIMGGHADVVHFGLRAGFIQSDADYGVLHGSKNQSKEGGGDFFLEKVSIEKTCLEKNYLGFGSTPVIAVADMTLQGTHHQLNALAMIALCRPFNVQPSHFKEVVNAFTGLPHRTQLVGCYEGVTWVNDSKGTNVGATLTAVESFGSLVKGTEKTLILLLGGVSKEADFSGLQPAVNALCRHTIIFGQDKQIIANALTGVDIQQVETLSEAVALAHSLSGSGDTVLFSPACASFDQFSHYIQRGEAFITLVHNLYDDTYDNLHDNKGFKNAC